jgi:hypothetical protein
MEKAFLLSKDDLNTIILALEDKIEIFKQIVEDEAPEEQGFLDEMIELCADLRIEYDNY